MSKIKKEKPVNLLKLIFAAALALFSLVACFFIVVSYMHGVNGFIRTIAGIGLERTVTQIDSWVDIKKTTILNVEKSIIAFSDYPENLQIYFSEILKADKDLSDVYFGTIKSIAEDGYFYDGLGWKPPVGYDWTTREWYKKALTSDNIKMTTPYRDFVDKDFKTTTSGKMVFSISKRILQSDRILGIVAADISTETLNQIVYNSSLTKNSNLYILDKEGIYITHSKSENIGKTNIFEEYPDLIKNKDKILSGDFYIDDNMGDGTYFTSIGLTELGWTLIARGQLSDFNDSTSTIIFLSVTMLLLAAFFIFLIIRSWRSFAQLQIAKNTIDQYNKKLEGTIAERTSSLRNILDNTGQGFFTFGSDFIIDPDFSKGCIDIFGKGINGLSVTDVIFTGKEDTAKEFKQGFELFFANLAKSAIIIDLVEKNAIIRGKIISIQYKEIANKKILCVLTDITIEKEFAERNKLETERHQRILRVLNNKHFFAEYLKEADDLFSSLEMFSNRTPSNEDVNSLLRSIHTFKGNSGFFGFNETQEIAHESEVEISDSLVLQTPFSYHSFTLELKKAYYKEQKIITDTMGDSWLEEASGIIIPRDAYNKIVHYVRSKLSSEQKLIHYLDYYHKVSFKDIFSRLPFIAAATAEKLGKKINPMVISGGEIRVLPEKFQPLSEACIHLVNNMIDHGIEFPYEREAIQKLPAGKIELFINTEKSHITLEFRDDGRGINLKEIEHIALEKGLIKPNTSVSSTELLNLIFTDGFSTRTDATKTSGRGLGLAAVKEETTKLGGSIEVRTRLGKGTIFEIMIPFTNS